MMTRYRREIDLLFFILIVTLIFAPIPKLISLEILGTTGKEFAIYPLSIGIMLTTYVWIISKRKTDSFTWTQDDEAQSFFAKIKWYLSIFLLVLTISVIAGVIFYPYYGQILLNNGFLPVRLTQVMRLFHSENISKVGIALWLIIKGMKNIILDTVWLFGGAFLIYFWYKNKPERCFDLLIKGIITSLGIIFLYELIELPYLLGSKTAAHILATINPYIHQIGQFDNIYTGSSNAEVQAYAWWPPLLWKHQVRSVFPEPSFFGLYCAFAIPWLWYVWLKNRKNSLFSKKCIFLALVIFTIDFLVFATQARTAVILFMGETMLLVFYGIYRREKTTWLRIISVILFTILAFVGSLVFSQYEKNGLVKFNGTEPFLQKKGENYISKNITSAVGKNQRSNRARFSLMEAELKLWTEHPIFGVGKGLKGAYIPEKLPVDATKSAEVRMWISRLHANGPLKASFPDVSEYTSKLCEIGLLGCLLYYFPVLYLVFYFALFLWRNRVEKKHLEIRTLIFFYSISLIGILAGGISTSLNVNYCFGVLMGIGLILYQQVKSLDGKE